jgi:hypothetical protein
MRVAEATMQHPGTPSGSHCPGSHCPGSHCPGSQRLLPAALAAVALLYGCATQPPGSSGSSGASIPSLPTPGGLPSPSSSSLPMPGLPSPSSGESGASKSDSRSSSTGSTSTAGGGQPSESVARPTIQGGSGLPLPSGGGGGERSQRTTQSSTTDGASDGTRSADVFRRAQQQRRDGDGTGESDSEVESDWPLPPSQGGSTASADTGRPAAGTAGAQSGDDAFEQVLGDLDSEIKDERAVIAARRNSSADGLPEEEQATAQAGSRGAGSGTGGEGGGTGADTGPPGGETTTAGGQRGPPGRGGLPTVASAQPVPADIPDGSDDDVLARQLREAATNEPDPALRERLWEEYRRYKAEQ